MRDEILTYISPTARVEFSHRRIISPFWCIYSDVMDGLENVLYTAKCTGQDV